jgi:poly-gamma-glutamate capsule biosynthesis protein CapA/YwtB (metallophosphatase superfamily)
VGGAAALVAAALLLADCGGTVREARDAAGARGAPGPDPTALHQTAGARVSVEPVALEKPAKPAPSKPRPTKPTKPKPTHPASGITFAAVGDTMLGNSPELPADPGAYLDPVRSQLKADSVFANLEGTLTDESYSPKCGGSSGGDCYAFRTPPSDARALAAAGFTIVNDANNHSSDFGPAGLADTIAALHRAGIRQTGLPGKITIERAGGERVAFLGFAPYASTASLLDLPAARALIRRASRRADIVVVAIHAGAEGTAAQHVTGGEEHYLGEDRGNPERFAQMAVRAGADLVLGSGPHVLRGMQIYRGRLIAYSLGNFSGFHNFDTSGVLGASAVLHVTLDPGGRFRSGRIASVRLVEAGRPELDPSGEGARLVAALSHEDFGASGVRVGGEGRILGKRGG